MKLRVPVRSRAGRVATLLLAFAVAFSISFPTAFAAEDDDFVELPSKKKSEAKPLTSSSPQKNKTASRSVETETMLQGVVYDLKQTRNREPSPGFPVLTTTNGKYQELISEPTRKVLQEFVNGPWQKSIDAVGRVSFPALNRFYCSPTRVWTSSFYTGETNSASTPQFFACEKDITPLAMVCIYSGYVVAPFSGQFRFVGGGDDFFLVRFNQKIVLDYGYCFATLGVGSDATTRASLSKKNNDQQNNTASKNNKNPIQRIMPTITHASSLSSDKSLYSRISLELYSTAFANGIAYGAPIRVIKGDVIPIEILWADMGNAFSCVLFFEMLDSNGKALNPGKPLLLFRTSEELPPSFSSDASVAYDKNSPVWRVVNEKGRSIPAHVRKSNPAKQEKETASGKDSGANKTSSSESAESKQTSAKPVTQTESSTSTEKKENAANATGGKVVNPFGVVRPSEHD